MYPGITPKETQPLAGFPSRFPRGMRVLAFRVKGFRMVCKRMSGLLRSHVVQLLSDHGAPNWVGLSFYRVVISWGVYTVGIIEVYTGLYRNIWGWRMENRMGKDTEHEMGSGMWWCMGLSAR